jgi:hypothetical protein
MFERCGVRSWNYLLGFQFVSAIARKRGSMDWYSTPNMWHSSIYFHCEHCMENGGGYVEHSFVLQWALANHLLIHLSYLSYLIIWVILLSICQQIWCVHKAKYLVVERESQGQCMITNSWIRSTLLVFFLMHCTMLSCTYTLVLFYLNGSF